MRYTTIKQLDLCPLFFGSFDKPHLGIKMESLQPAFMLMKLFGFNAFTYRQTSAAVTSSWSRSGIVLVVLNMTVNLLFSYHNATRTHANHSKSGSYLLDGGGRLTLAFSYTSMLAAIAIRLNRRKLMVKILNNFRLIDQRMASNRMLLDHRRETRLVMNYIVMFAGVVMLVAVGVLYVLYLLGTARIMGVMYAGKVFVSCQGLVLAHSGFLINQVLVRRIQLLNRRLRWLLHLQFYST